MSKNVHVLVVGGGVAGLTVARRTSRLKGFRTTLVNAKEYCEYKFPLNSSDLEKVTFPLKKILNQLNVKFVLGEVVDLQANECEVRNLLNKTHKIQFDYCVVATGKPVVLQYHYLDVNEPSPEDCLLVNRQRRLKKLHVELRELEETGGKVVVLGGDQLEVELVNELRLNFPSLSLVLANPYPKCLEKVCQKAYLHCERYMEQKKVQVLNYRDIDETLSELDKPCLIFQLQPVKRAFLKKFQTVEGLISVNRQLQAKNSDDSPITNIFSVGSCSSLDSNFDLVLENIQLLENKKEPKTVKPSRLNVHIVSLGTNAICIVHSRRRHRFSYSGPAASMQKRFIQRVKLHVAKNGRVVKASHYKRRLQQSLHGH